MTRDEQLALKALYHALRDLVDSGVVDADELREGDEDLADAIGRALALGEAVLHTGRGDAFDRSWMSREHRAAIARAVAENERDPDVPS